MEQRIFEKEVVIDGLTFKVGVRSDGEILFNVAKGFDPTLHVIGIEGVYKGEKLQAFSTFSKAEQFEARYNECVENARTRMKVIDKHKKHLEEIFTALDSAGFSELVGSINV